jgi:uncharacterized membrane-anchored protein YjiN (DUF445 family)
MKAGTQRPGANSRAQEATLTELEKSELKRLNEKNQQLQTSWLQLTLSFEFQRRAYEAQRAKLLDEIERASGELQSRSKEILLAHKLDTAKNWDVDWGAGTIKLSGQA